MKKVSLLAIIITSMIAAYPAVSKAMVLGTYDFAGSGGSSSFLTELEFRLESSGFSFGPLFVISWVAGPEHVGDTLFVSSETDAYFEIAAYVLRNGVSDHISFGGGGGGSFSTDCSSFTKVPGVETEYCDFHGCNITAISLTVHALTLDHPTDSWTNYSYDVTFTIWGDPPVPKPAMIYYVDADASGVNDGSSWADAFNYLQDALIAASRGDEIRVAEGIYTPDRGAGMTPGDRRATFQPIIGVTIKGGYAGFGEPEPNDCDIELFKTILSGDLAGNDVEVVDPLYLLNNPRRAENSYCVVIETGTDGSAVLDGFTIIGGNAGGMCNLHSRPRLNNCTFRGNSGYEGGGMNNYYDSKPTLVNCTFSGNSGKYGGGMYNRSSSPTLTNCIFTANLSTSEGAGIYNYNERSENNSLILTNCTFHENSASNGNALAFDSNKHRNPSSVQITNCIFWDGGNEIWNNDNSTVTIIHSDVQGGWPGEGNIDADPCFARPGYWVPTLAPRAIEPNPPDGAINVSVYSDLSWTAGSKATSHDIYFGTRNPPPFVCNQTTTTFDPGTMCDNTTYYWRIDEVNDTDITYGNTWNFMTIIISPPPPPSSMSILTASYTDDSKQYIWFEGDYHLLPDSPCIDAGDPNYVAEPNETDLDGNPRIINGRIDMGAYEYIPPVPAEVDIDPNTLNLKSKGKWITAFIWLPEDYNVTDIDPNSVYLEGEIEPELFWLSEDQQIAIAKFDRQEVQSILNVGEVELTITGNFIDGIPFEATNTIKVIDIGGKENKAAIKSRK